MKLAVLLLLVSCSTPIEKITVSKEVEISEKFFVEEKKSSLPIEVKKTEGTEAKKTNTLKSKKVIRPKSKKKVKVQQVKVEEVPEKKVHWSEVFGNNISPMKLTFAVDYSKISVGDMILEVLPQNQNEITIQARFETNEFYKFFYDIKNKVEVKLKSGSLAPIETNVYKKHGEKTINEKQIFSSTGLIYKENKVKDGKKSSRENKINLRPNSKELLGLIFYSMYVPDNELEGKKIELILKDKIYHVNVEKFSKKLINFKNKQLSVREISFKSYKDGKSQKKGSFSITHTIGEKPILVSIIGHLKIGRLKGILTKAE